MLAADHCSRLVQALGRLSCGPCPQEGPILIRPAPCHGADCGGHTERQRLSEQTSGCAAKTISLPRWWPLC
jgi:hypothetical protein